LTSVTDYVTHVLTLLIEGRIPDAILFAEQGAAPARGSQTEGLDLRPSPDTNEIRHFSRLARGRWITR
jgi:hypothetical protein